MYRIYVFGGLRQYLDFIDSKNLKTNYYLKEKLVLNSTANKNSYSAKYDLEKEQELRTALENSGFNFKPADLAFWRAQNKNVTVTLYKSGKILAQGNGTADFIDKYLGVSSLNQNPSTKIITTAPQIKYSSWIGTDESGKGDYFGPLIIAGVLVDQSNVEILQNLGVKDSKKISDETIEKITWQIKSNCIFSVVTVSPAKYNQLYEKFKNLNSLLAWGHATAIEALVEGSGCKKVIIDQFADERVVLSALKRKGISLDLDQRHRGEEDLVVAAASILARDTFVKRLKKLSEEIEIDLPKGASKQVVEAGRRIFNKSGLEGLSKVSKLHFKTLDQIRDNS